MKSRCKKKKKRVYFTTRYLLIVSYHGQYNCRDYDDSCRGWLLKTNIKAEVGFENILWWHRILNRMMGWHKVLKIILKTVILTGYI